MSVGRKEGNNLVEKAGKAIIDLAFSLSSRHAISNAACSEGMRLRNVCEYNGKLYKLNLDGTRGDEIKMGGGLPRLDLKKPVHAFTSSAPSGLPAGATYGLTFTATEKCYLSGGLLGSYASAGILTINGFEYAHSGVPVNNNGGNAVYIDCLELSEGDVVQINRSNSYLYIYKLKED